MNYKEALEYIHGVNWTFCKPGLERIGELCERLGNPQDSLRFVHVAGTNGKGSFCAMLESALRSSGYKVGLYTSPYISVFNERMRVNGKNIEDSCLAHLTDIVRPYADSMQDKPTEFELITAIAFEYFKREKCDVVILEAGMGGRLDSTNIIKTPVLSVITGIALDHTAFLGDTVEKIAAEKAGIIKNGVPVLWGGEDCGAGRVISECAAARSADFYTPSYDDIKELSATLSGSVFDYKAHTRVKISLLGLYQPKNAALVLDAVDILRNLGFSLREEDVMRGLSEARWQARFEIIKKEPLTIFDGAHNPQGISAAVESILHYFGSERVVVLTGVLADKDYDFIARTLARIAAYAVTITPENPRALCAQSYSEVLQKYGVPSCSAHSIPQALSEAMKTAREEGRAIVCLGSLYTYSDVVSALE